MEQDQDNEANQPFLDEYKDIDKSEIPFYEKSEGTKQFKDKNFEQAIKHYSKALLAIKFLKDSPEMTDQTEKLMKEIIIPCNLNLSLCNIKIGNYTSAIKFADEVLKIDENNLKALYRRGTSQMKKSNFGEAKQDLYLAKKLDPEDKQIDQAMKQLAKNLEQQKAREKLMSEKMLKGYKSLDKEKNFLSKSLEKIKALISNLFSLCKRRKNTKKQE